MQIERFYLSCLSHASYILSSQGEAVVIDPQRDVEIYLDHLSRYNLTLRYIIETHLHADFVSGHLELAGATGAEIVVGARARATYPHHPVSDGDILQVGSISLSIIETPGHTPEGITIAASDSQTPDEPVALFTGDTLFAGDVGRPDLLGEVGVTKEELGGMLYDSLHSKLLRYPDMTRVYPAHGAGSSCGKSLRNVEFSTIGAEKMTNYALQPMTREEFIAAITEGQPEAPGYFLQDATINRQGAPAIDDVLKRTRPIGVDDLAELAADGVILLDTRAPEEFSREFIPGSINIGLDGQFATWVGTLLPMNVRIAVIAPEGREQESMLRCARVGYDSVVGWLEGGIDAWKRSGRALESFGRVDAGELASMLDSARPPLVLDVRKDGERQIGHIPGSEYITLSALESRLGEIDPDGRPIVVHCAGGYRSAMAASILMKHGFTNVSDLRGGIGAWERAGLAVETGAEASV
jgi:rhodanese-related sulfurtransferase/glyoxylase-like metal-dependent hydrolase (beta-lactamase superfamily II)